MATYPPPGSSRRYTDAKSSVKPSSFCCSTIDSPSGSRESGRLRHVRRLRSFLALHDFELDAIAFGQGLEAGPLNRAEMHEHIRSALPRNKTVPLRVVEPLHGASETSHCDVPRTRSCGSRKYPARTRS